MATVSVTNHVNNGAIMALLRSPTGGVAQDLLRRGKLVETAAKKNLNSIPRRVDTGLLRSSIQAKLVQINGTIGVRIGTTIFYARFVHDGTGLYGPRRQMIVPRTKRVLRWKSGGRTVYSMKSRGMRPNQFMKNALRAARG